jgi:N-acetylneuraminic acid mutarotase
VKGPRQGNWSKIGQFALRPLLIITIVGILMALPRVPVVESAEPPVRSTELYDPAANDWHAAASMAAARSNHTATLLKSGKILVAGGVGEAASLYLASSEVYDPDANRWAAAPAMAVSRGNHTATALPNGMVLVVGGVKLSDAPTPLASAELFGPVTNTWSEAASMRIPRFSHAATLLADGSVLVTGGITGGGISAVAELFHPDRNQWSAAGQMRAARWAHTSTLLEDGRVLVAGGRGIVAALASTEVYDPKANAWFAGPTMVTGHRQHTATLLGTGPVLVVGGDPDGSAELYEPRANSWSVAGRVASGRGWHTASPLANGKVLVVGGGGGDTFITCVGASAELYDPRSNTWSSAGRMAVVRSRHTATLLGNGRVFVTGGATDYLGSGCRREKTAPPTAQGKPPLIGSIAIPLALAAIGIAGIVLLRVARRKPRSGPG